MRKQSGLDKLTGNEHAISQAPDPGISKMTGTGPTHVDMVMKGRSRSNDRTGRGAVARLQQADCQNVDVQNVVAHESSSP